jgi:hypothetical protein
MLTMLTIPIPRLREDQSTSYLQWSRYEHAQYRQHRQPTGGRPGIQSIFASERLMLSSAITWKFEVSAARLYDLLHPTAWTTGSELLGELLLVLKLSISFSISFM